MVMVLGGGGEGGKGFTRCVVVPSAVMFVDIERANANCTVQRPFLSEMGLCSGPYTALFATSASLLFRTQLRAWQNSAFPLLALKP